MKGEEIYDIAIIGTGVVGLGAAMYAGRFNMKTVVFGDIMGGTIILTDVVENYPGFKRLTGLELADKIKEHALDYDIKLVEEKVEDVSKEKESFVLKAGGKAYKSRTVLFATGTKWKKLNIPGEEEFANKGVHYCALCDGAFYKGKVVAVVGGSDSAAKEALALTQFAEKVYIIYRGEEIHPEPVNMKRVKANRKIEIVNKTNIKEIRGDRFVTHVILDKPYNRSARFDVDAVFVAIGHIALSGLAKPLGVRLNQKGEIIINRRSETNIPGVYAAGDVGDLEFKQAITGVAEGVTGVYSAYQYVTGRDI